MLASEIIAKYRELSEDDTVPYHCSEAELLYWLNEGLREACRRSSILFDSTTANMCVIPVTSSSAIYDKDSRVNVVTKAHYADSSGEYHKVDIKDRDELDRISSDWRSDSSGTPLYLIVDDSSVQLVPAPGSDITLYLELYRDPLIDVVIAGTPEIAPKHHEHLVDWLLKSAYGKRDSDIFGPELSAEHEQLFADYFGEKKNVNSARFARANTHHRTKVW